MRYLLAVLVLAACGRTNEFQGSMGGGASSGGGSAAGGGSATGGGGQTSCNTVPDDSPTYFPGCPGGGTCTGCDLLPGDGGAITDGTYRAAQDILWESACGSISMVPSHASLVIANGNFQLVSTGPQGLGSSATTVRINASYSTDGGTIFFTPTCGQNDATSARYTAAGDLFSLTGFPGLIGNPVFVKRP